jgi:large subunit ribosomal protein L4e
MKMVKIAIVDKTGKKVGDYDLKLSEDIRDDIFKKAVTSETSIFRESHGATPLAGKKTSINVTKRRQKFRSTYGKGGSRTPKKTMWRRGIQVRFVGAFAPNTVGGRRAHPPKASKILFKNMNNKEWLKALKVGVMASMDNSIVSSNGQRVPKSYPMVLDESLEKVAKTKDFKDILVTLGFADEIERTSVRKVRAGKGTMRNRTYKHKRGPLVVVSSMEAPLLKAVRNVKGFDVITPELLMVSDFGMSYKPGRAVIFTKPAIEEFVEVFN